MLAFFAVVMYLTVFLTVYRRAGYYHMNWTVRCGGYKGHKDICAGCVCVCGGRERYHPGGVSEILGTHNNNRIAQQRREALKKVRDMYLSGLFSLNTDQSCDSFTFADYCIVERDKVNRHKYKMLPVAFAWPVSLPIFYLNMLNIKLGITSSEFFIPGPRIETKDQAIKRLTAANEAMEAENDRLYSELGIEA